MNSESKKVYFPHLNGLRFLAATLVIFHHIEQYKYYAGKENSWGGVQIDNIGVKAVSLFFVLSGFLITYLLLAEDKKFGKISLKNFYIRRILRIWPLYYLIVFFVLLLPFIIDLKAVFGFDFFDKPYFIVISLLLILPNITRLFMSNLVGGNQLWSIGVEEQFYIFWPICIRYFIHRILSFLLIFIAIKFFCTLIVQVTFTLHIEDGIIRLLVDKLYFFLKIFKVEQMAIGAIGAYFLYQRERGILNFINIKIVQVLMLLGLFCIFTFDTKYWLFSYLEGVLFTMLIINLVTNQSMFFNFENKILSYLGNLSYGIYMYHTLVIALLIYALEVLQINDTFSINLTLYTLAPILTILVAWGSYESFEKYFLQIKTQFMKIRSTPSKVK